MSAARLVTSSLPPSRTLFSVHVGNQLLLTISYLATPMPFNPMYATSSMTTTSELSVSSPASQVSVTVNEDLSINPTPFVVPPKTVELFIPIE